MMNEDNYRQVCYYVRNMEVYERMKIAIQNYNNNNYTQFFIKFLYEEGNYDLEEFTPEADIINARSWKNALTGNLLYGTEIDQEDIGIEELINAFYEYKYIYRRPLQEPPFPEGMSQYQDTESESEYEDEVIDLTGDNCIVPDCGCGPNNCCCCGIQRMR